MLDSVALNSNLIVVQIKLVRKLGLGPEASYATLKFQLTRLAL